MLYSLLARYRFYPWLVAGLCTIIVATSNGMINSGITVFDEALLQEFGWSVSELKLRDSINFLGASTLVLAAGWLVDRIGVRPLLLLGMLLLAAGYYGYSHIQSLPQVYALHLLFALVAACGGNMVAIVTAATWMPHRRGLAVGMAIAGTSVGGMLLPPFANWLNQNFGWRQSLQYEALIPLVVALLVFLLVSNRRPADSKGNAAPENERPDGVPFAQVVRQPVFYQVAAAGACTYFAILALFSHLFLYMRSLDYGTAQASLAISALAFSALVGKLAAGWLADTLNPYRVFKAQMLVMLVGLVGISQLPGLIWPSLVLAGLGWGSLHTLYNFILLSLFGMRDAGKINGSVSVAEALGGGAGIFLTGLLFDQFGNYPSAMWCVIGVMALGCVLVLLLRQPEATEEKAVTAAAPAAS